MKRFVWVALSICILWTSVASAASDPLASLKKQVANLQAQLKRLTTSNTSLQLTNENLTKLISDLDTKIDVDGTKTSSLVTFKVGTEQIIRIPANPAKGFNYPYYLSIPATMVAGRYLMVESTNTGTSSDDLSTQEEHVKQNHILNHQLSKMLDVPLLMPVFPRPKSQPLVHTHDLDRDTLTIRTGDMARMDLQLIGMIHHAQALFAVNRVPVQEKVVMTGHSASGRFATKFAALHPEMVFALTAGGIDGASILPVRELKGKPLRFPMGVADFQELTGQPFDLQAYKKVRQFIFMGGKDTSDMTVNDDGYDRVDSLLIWDVLGKDMVSERWPAYQNVMKAAGVSAQFHTYTGIGHTNTYRTFADQAAFLKANMGSSAFKTIQADSAGN